MDVKCPTCQKRTVYDTANDFRPFCSDRCKLIDTAGWATEEFSIPGPSLIPDEQELLGTEPSED